MTYKEDDHHLIATCKICDNDKLKVILTEDSIVGLCAKCDILVFDVVDIPQFLEDIWEEGCKVCGKGKKTRKN